VNKRARNYKPSYVFVPHAVATPGLHDLMEKAAVDPWANRELPEGVRTLVLGVHRVIYVAPPPRAFAIPGKNLIQERTGTFARTLPSARWLLRELHRLGPVSYATMLGLQVALHLQPTVKMYLNHRVLSMVRAISSQQSSSCTNARRRR
jgi:hypothetical protein